MFIERQVLGNPPSDENRIAGVSPPSADLKNGFAVAALDKFEDFIVSQAADNPDGRENIPHSAVRNEKKIGAGAKIFGIFQSREHLAIQPEANGIYMGIIAHGGANEFVGSVYGVEDVLASNGGERDDVHINHSGLSGISEKIEVDPVFVDDAIDDEIPREVVGVVALTRIQCLQRLGFNADAVGDTSEVLRQCFNLADEVDQDISSVAKPRCLRPENVVWAVGTVPQTGKNKLREAIEGEHFLTRGVEFPLTEEMVNRNGATEGVANEAKRVEKRPFIDADDVPNMRRRGVLGELKSAAVRFLDSFPEWGAANLQIPVSGVSAKSIGYRCASSLRDVHEDELAGVADYHAGDFILHAMNKGVSGEYSQGG